MENLNLRLGLGVAFILALCFAGYEYKQKKNDEAKSIMVVDRSALTVKIAEIYEDSKLHHVDLQNVNTNEIYFYTPISKECPQFDNYDLSQPIDAVKIDFLNGQTGEKWSDFDGVYQKVCWGKNIYNHSSENSNESEAVQQ